MNIRQLENYMAWCSDDNITPSISGLKKYDYQAELKQRIYYFTGNTFLNSPRSKSVSMAESKL